MKHAYLMLFLLTSCGFKVVGTGNRGVKVRFGEVIGEPLTEGLYFYNPFTTGIKQISIQDEKFSQRTSIFTKDTQRTDIEFAAIWHIDPTYVGQLYKQVGTQDEIEEKILKPVVLAGLKDAIGQVIADELIGKREGVTSSALETVKRNLSDRHIIVSGLQFTNIDFDNAYEKAVEQKVVAIQDAQKAKNKTVQVEEEAKQTVKRATAEAESMKIKSQALAQNKGLVQFEAVQKWDGKLPVNMYGNAPIPFLNLKGD
jgi:prohibitin 1